MRAYVSLGLISLTVMVGVAGAQDNTAAPASSAPQFVRTLHDPSDLTGKFLPKPLLSAARQEGLDLQALRGRPVVLSYWTTWCERCGRWRREWVRR